MRSQMPGLRSRFEKIWDYNEGRESARSDRRPGQGGDFRMTATEGLYVSLLPWFS